MLRRWAVQALGHMHCVQLSYDSVTRIFWRQILQIERDIQSTNRTLSRPTLLIVVTETIVKARGGLRWEIESTEVESGSHRGQAIPLSARHVLLHGKSRLSLFSCLWHCNRYLTFTRGNSAHPTLNGSEDVWHRKSVAIMNSSSLWQDSSCLG